MPKDRRIEYTSSMPTDFQNIAKKALALHKKSGGVFSVASKLPVRGPQDLKLIYTPGVGAVSAYIAMHPKEVRAYTMKGNSVAVVSDGSAVLGLGNIGPEGALPVMEGKAVLFKKFANIDAVPIVLATQNVEEIIRTVKFIAPAFGGINLEDISAPRCFEIEERLKRELDIPVMHDDQHGTAVIVLAGLVNALKVVRKKLPEVRVTISGAGAAGTAVAKIIKRAGGKHLLVCDSRGILAPARKDLTSEKRNLAIATNPKGKSGTLEEALRGADVFIGVSAPKIVSEDMIREMAHGGIVFALANPIPEIMPDLAMRSGARVIATGRSDFPNQLNNSKVFPGVFRGALDHHVRQITDAMKIRAAYAMANMIPHPTPQRIVPGMFEKRLVSTIASAIRE